MKKLFILPAFVLLITGASSNNVEPQVNRPIGQKRVPAISTKLDSINVKTAELNELIKQL